jgi:hypothetical protein
MSSASYAKFASISIFRPFSLLAQFTMLTQKDNFSMEWMLIFV